MPKWKPMLNKRSGRLVVIEDFRNEKGLHVCRCKCDCGNEKIVRACHIESKAIKSCGCINIENGVERFYVHGMKGTIIYKRWTTMRRRCYDKNFVGYENYGGRGITVCERWLEFQNFYDDMHETFNNHVNEFGEKDTTLDRIDVNGNYEPSNCRWATKSEQSINKRDVRIYQYHGNEYNIRQLAALLNEDNIQLLRGRLYNNKFNVMYVVDRWYANEQAR